MLIEKNISSLQEMGATCVILKSCANLPILKRFMTNGNKPGEINTKCSSEFIGAKLS